MSNESRIRKVPALRKSSFESEECVNISNFEVCRERERTKFTWHFVDQLLFRFESAQLAPIPTDSGQLVQFAGQSSLRFVLFVRPGARLFRLTFVRTAAHISKRVAVLKLPTTNGQCVANQTRTIFQIEMRQVETVDVL